MRWGNYSPTRPRAPAWPRRVTQRPEHFLPPEAAALDDAVAAKVEALIEAEEGSVNRFKGWLGIACTAAITLAKPAIKTFLISQLRKRFIPPATSGNRYPSSHFSD